MKHSILVALKDSVSSRAAVSYLADLPLCREEVRVTLLHVFKTAPASREFMGETFSKEESSRVRAFLEDVRNRLVEKGFDRKKTEIKLQQESHPTIADGIIDECRKTDYDMVIIARKKKSKAEEFVMGDVSIKLVRTLEGTAVLVVKPL